MSVELFAEYAKDFEPDLTVVPFQFVEQMENQWKEDVKKLNRTRVELMYLMKQVQSFCDEHRAFYPGELLHAVKSVQASQRGEVTLSL